MSDNKGIKNPNYKTGLMIKGSTEKGIHNTWMNMKQRCTNPNHPKYPRYGGRGIKVYADWFDINNFYQWAKESGWFVGASIDRKDNDGDYCPENCHWVSMSENSRKKRTTKLSIEQATEIRSRLNKGENAYDLAKEYGVVHGTIWFIQKNFTHVAEGECTKKLKSRSDETKRFLTKENALEIYHNKILTQLELSKLYGVSRGNIDAIKNGRSWSSVTGHKRD